MNTHGRVATHEIDGNLIDVYYDEDASDQQERVMNEAWARCCKIRTQTKK